MALYKSERLSRFRCGIAAIKAGFEQLPDDVPEPTRMKKIVRCLDDVLNDLTQIN